MEILFYSHLNSDTVITRKFWQWHDSYTVVARAKICCDLMASNGITARGNFHRILIAAKKVREMGPWPKFTDNCLIFIMGIPILVRLHFDTEMCPRSYRLRILSLNSSLVPGQEWSGGRFKNTYELLNLRALKFSPVDKIYIFQCMGKIFCVEFQRYPLKFHTKYLTHTLKDITFIQHWNFKSS